MGGTLVASQLVGLRFDYSEIQETSTAMQAIEVRSAAAIIDQYLQGIERQVAEVSALPWDSGALGPADRRLEYQRLMKLIPAIAEIRYADAAGIERVRTSRIDRDVVNGTAPSEFADDIRVARERGTSVSEVYFADGTEPYTRFSMRDRSGGGVTVVGLNLRFVGDVVLRIHVGHAGHAYVVDRTGHLVAHPNLSLVLRQTMLGSTPAFVHVTDALARRPDEPVPMFDSTDLGGERVMASAAPLSSAPWVVMVEQPRSEVLAPLYERLARTALLTVAGLLLAVLASAILARRLAEPILQVRLGAERIASGDLGARIDVRTGDEVEMLARQFNAMAGQLQEYTRGLEQKVTEKTAELELANRHKSEFLANMSHELRTPLNAVIGFSDALRERIFGDLNPKQMEYVADIHASGQHLLSLINDILDLAKIEAGRMELELRTFDVATAMENCRALIRERAHRQKLTLEFKVAPSIGSWRADERKFKQVMLNLLSNAVKFTPPGGAVRVEAANGGEWLEIRVSDTGPGIAKTDQAAIFEEFRQLRTSGESKEGTGLGLALARRLTEVHGGTLEVESDLGRGATFILRLPRRPAHSND